MTDKLVLYTNPMSRGRIARWMLEEVGAPYETEIIAYDRIKDDAFQSVNPMGKVPALRHGDAIVTETAAICAYLADSFPDAGLAPPPGKRAAYYRWLFFGAGPLEAGLMNKGLGIEIPADKERMAGYGNFELLIRTLEAAVSASDYIAGDAFTAADVYVGSHIGWGMQFGTLEPRPAFKAYWDRIGNRPACKRAAEIDDALLAKEKADA